VNGFRIVLVGDATALVEFEERIDPVVNARAVATAEVLRSASIAGVRDVVPTYRSVAVYFDPLLTDHRGLMRRLGEAAEAAMEPPLADGGGHARIRVPVCYGDDFGPDLKDIAAFADASEADVIEIHTSRTYRVFMLGFMPGFAYMGMVDSRIAVPRREAPRVRVPRG
jgi:inhibitor of KinA